MNSATWIALAWQGLKRLGNYLKKPETYWKVRRSIEEKERQRNEKILSDINDGR